MKIQQLFITFSRNLKELYFIITLTLITLLILVIRKVLSKLAV